MKKRYILTLATLAGLVSLNSCKKVLDKQDLGSFAVSQVFNDSTVAKLDMDYIYGQNQPSWYGNSGGAVSGAVTGLTDETAGTSAYVQGTVTQETEGDIGSASTAGPYNKLATINLFIANMNAGTLPGPMKRRFDAQAYFWRAYRYFELVKIYGGVPLVTTPLPVVGTDNKAAALLPRATTTATFAQIFADLDSCIAILPSKWPQTGDYGRITAGAAAAFKGRVSLTFASPQFNPNNIASRWTDALAANNKAVQILSAANYGLYPKWDYTMWTTEGSSGTAIPANPEAVLVTEYNNVNDANYGNNNPYDASVRPKNESVSSGGANTPSYDISLAFPMADGLAPTTSVKYPYTLQNFYKNRDPRFYQTIAYNGCSWPLQVTLTNGTFNGYIWTYNYPTSAIGATLTTTNTEGSNSSASGFYLRKAVNPTVALANLPYSTTDWIEIRYAEVLLNQAECAAETGDLTTPMTNLIAIRKRAGIEANTTATATYGLKIGMSHDEMINAIMTERQIELAFEGKRYWDLRRRKLLEATFNTKSRNKMVITLANTGTKSDYILATRDASAATSAGIDALYASTFQVTVVAWDTFKINYQPADYFFGIPTASLQNNAALIQNNTWGGAFDPLQ